MHLWLHDFFLTPVDSFYQSILHFYPRDIECHLEFLDFWWFFWDQDFVSKFHIDIEWILFILLVWHMLWFIPNLNLLLKAWRRFQVWELGWPVHSISLLCCYRICKRVEKEIMMLHAWNKYFSYSLTTSHQKSMSNFLSSIS